MQVEWYEPTRRDNLRAAASLSTTKGKKRAERCLDEAYKTLHWRIQHEGYKLRPEDVPAYQQWLAKHPELYKNPHE